MDYDFIRAHAKPFFGFSDVTALQLGLLAKAGVISFSGMIASYLLRENAAQIKRNDRRSKRHDFFVAVISAVVSALMTLLVEHFDEIVVFFVEQLSE